MIVQNAYSAGQFVYCVTNWSPHETNTYFNEGDGHFHQWVYIVDGWGIGEIRETPTGPNIRREDEKQPGALVDLSPTRGYYHVTTTKESPLTMMMFNPIPADRNLSVEMVKGPTTKTVEAVDTRTTIVCITGPITANDKTLTNLQHAKVFPGKTAELTLPENTVVALVKEVV